MEKEIIIINGTGGSGKDTFVEFASKYAKILNFSSVDKVKEIARLIGWNGQKNEKDRKFLSDLKKLTTEYNEMSLRSILEAVQAFYSSACEIMFIHIREPEEIEKAKKNISGNVKTILIKRKGLENINSNYSDASVDNYNYDYIINNTTLEELDNCAREFVNNLKQKKLTLSGNNNEN